MKYIWGIALLLGIACFSYWLWFSPVAPTIDSALVVPHEEGAATSSLHNQPVGAMTETTLAQLFADTTPALCTLSYLPPDVDAAPILGTLARREADVRLTLNLPSTAPVPVVDALLTSQRFYVWSSASSGGTVTLLQEGVTLPVLPIPWDVAVEASCNTNMATIVTDTFVPPTTVIFTEVSTTAPPVMEDGTVYNETTNDQQCALCKRVVGDAQQECLQSFRCEE